MKSSRGKRNCYDIYADILKCCLKENAPTEVMKKINLSYASTKKYLASLIDLQFIKKDSKYVITSKGQEFLEKYNALSDLLIGDSGASLKNISLINKMESRRFR